MASRNRPRARSVGYSLPGRLPRGPARRGAFADERLGRAGLSPRLRRRVLRPHSRVDGQAAGDHRSFLRAGAPRHHLSAALGHPNGLRAYRAWRLPARPRRTRLPRRAPDRHAERPRLAGVLRRRGQARLDEEKAVRRVARLISVRITELAQETAELAQLALGHLDAD